MSEPEKLWGFPVFHVELGGKPQPLPGALPLTVSMPNPNERAVRHALDAAGATADDLRAGRVLGYITTDLDCECKGTGIVHRTKCMTLGYHPRACRCVQIRIVRPLPTEGGRCST